jgi:hypothetical protein
MMFSDHLNNNRDAILNDDVISGVQLPIIPEITSSLCLEQKKNVFIAHKREGWARNVFRI